jgi:hypothetical protein
MSVPLYKKLYTAHMRTIIEDIYSVEYFEDLVNGIQDIIEPYAKDDPNLFPSFASGDYFRYNVSNYLVTPDDAHWCGITSTVRERLKYLLNHAEISKTAPVVSKVIQSNTKPVDGETVVITAETEGADLVELLVTTKDNSGLFISVPMVDDGTQGDGEANDNIFGATVPFEDGGSHVKYYIRASNDDALVLSPRKAETEFYEYWISLEMLPPETVVINEINYNSSDEFDSEDWIELYNPTEYTIDISGWLFKDANDDHVYIVPENRTLGYDQYMILSKDTTAFKALFPDVENYIGDLGFGLSGGGEQIRLFDSNGALMDMVEYDDSAPWPKEADGNGPTLELLSPSYDNSLAINWSASEGYGSPGRVNTRFVSLRSEVRIPTQFQVFDNYPNPFNPTTTISYELPIDGMVNITIYDLVGRKVKTFVNGKQTAGFKSYQWNATNDNGEAVTAGAYFYTVTAGDFAQTKKMVLLK